MISVAEAEKKFRQLDPKLTPEVEQLGKQILARSAVLTQANHDDSIVAKALLHFVENRLAQPHLGFLAPDQVNWSWGGATTVALQHLGDRHGLALDLTNPTIGSDFMRAILDGSKAFELPMPAANSYDWLQRQVAALKMVWTNKPGEFNVVAIRGYMVPTGAVPNIGNRWNDTFFVAWVDAQGKKQVRTWVGSTDPGFYYYSTNPVNPRGCAHAVAPQQIRYRPGPHGSQRMPAFVQDSNVTVARINAANYTDQTPRETDSPNNRFWINFHAGFAWSDAQGVDYSSAGCLTTKGAGWTDWRWISLRDLLRTDPRGWFYCTLIDSTQLKK